MALPPEVTGLIPNFSNLGASAFHIVTWFILILVFGGIAGVAAWLFLRNRKFNKKIVIFEEINGRFEPTRKDRAMEFKFGRAGDAVFYLQKHKKYLPMPVLQTGRRVYWFFIRQDGEWINFEPGDYNEQSRKLNAKFLDKEMRYARIALQKNLRERYEKVSIWQKYGVLITSIGFIAMIGILTWLLFDKWITLAQATNAGVETAAKVMEKVDKIIAALDNVCSGSGIRA